MSKNKEAEEQPAEPQYYGSGESILPREEPGIVITGGEQFGGKQGFIPAADAEAAGIAVTGKGTATTEEEETDTEEETTVRRTSSKSSAKGRKKR